MARDALASPDLRVAKAKKKGRPKAPDVSLAVPCYNEAGCLSHTVEELTAAFQAKQINVELVLVDNGSTDETADIIDEMIDDGLPVAKVTVTHNRGYGNGVLRGLEVCSGNIVGIIPADGQVDAADVVRLYHVLANARTPKLAKARRRFRMDGFKRKVVSIVFNVVANITFGGLRSIDINGTPKLFPREYLERMHLQSTDWFLDAEILLKAKRLGLPVFEMNVLAQMREDGESNVHATAIGEFLANLWKWRFGSARKVLVPDATRRSDQARHAPDATRRHVAP